MPGASRCLATVLAIVLLSCAAAGTQRAAPAVRSAAEPAADEVDAQMKRAAQEMIGGRPAVAAELYARVAALRPQDDVPLLGVARARLAAADLSASVAAADRALALRESPEARALRGRALARQRQWEAARADLERALAAAPEDAASWALLAAVEVNRGDRVAAAHAYRQTATRMPPADAAKLIWRELRFIPPDPVQPEESLDRCTRGYTAILEGHPGEALREASNGMRFAPDFEWCGVVRAEALLRANDPSGAEQLLRWAIRTYAAEHEFLRADAKGLLAELLSLRKESAAEAAALAREALAVRGERAAVLVALARACEATGDTACVRDVSARLLKLPHVPEALRAQAEERVR